VSDLVGYGPPWTMAWQLPPCQEIVEHFFAKCLRARREMNRLRIEWPVWEAIGSDLPGRRPAWSLQRTSSDWTAGERVVGGKSC